MPTRIPFLALLLAALCTLAHAAAPDTAKEQPRPILLPEIPARSVNVTDFGAVAGSDALNTAAFAKAIEALSAQGGGRLIVPTGLWRTGPITLRSRIELHLEKGALLQFSENRDDYPIVLTSFEGRTGYRCQAPISGHRLEHIAITGPGIIDGAGQAWRPVKQSKLTESAWKNLTTAGGVLNTRGDIWYPTESARAGHDNFPPDEATAIKVKDSLRPVLLQLVECTRILLDGPTFQNSPFWCLHPLLCDDLTIRNINVRNPWFAQNGDGLDLESCRHVLVENATFDVGDDAICMKSGRNEEGRKRGRPTAYVTIRDCVVYHGHGGFVVGSEMSGGVHDVRVLNCTFLGTDIGLRFKSNRGRGGTVENITVDTVRMTNIPTDAITFDLFYSAGEAPRDNSVVPPVSETTPTFRNILLRNITVLGARRAALLQGLPERPLSSIHLENVDITARTGITMNHTEGFTFTNLHLNVSEGTPLTVKQTREFDLKGFATAKPAAPAIAISGETTRALRLDGVPATATKLAPDVPAGAVTTVTTK